MNSRLTLIIVKMKRTKKIGIVNIVQLICFNHSIEMSIIKTGYLSDGDYTFIQSDFKRMYSYLKIDKENFN